MGSAKKSRRFSLAFEAKIKTEKGRLLELISNLGSDAKESRAKAEEMSTNQNRIFFPGVGDNHLSQACFKEKEKENAEKELSFLRSFFELCDQEKISEKDLSISFLKKLEKEEELLRTQLEQNIKKQQLISKAVYILKIE